MANTKKTPSADETTTAKTGSKSEKPASTKEKVATAKTEVTAAAVPNDHFEHTLTDLDLQENPSPADLNLKSGDVIGIPNTEDVDQAAFAATQHDKPVPGADKLGARLLMLPTFQHVMTEDDFKANPHLRGLTEVGELVQVPIFKHIHNAPETEHTAPVTPMTITPPLVNLALRDDMIHAKKANGQRTVFSRQEWEALAGDKAGWQVDVKVPDEVLNMQKQ